jgi:phosphoribosylaminoimidazole-succinocarboxamide synthase
MFLPESGPCRRLPATRLSACLPAGRILYNAALPFRSITMLETLYESRLKSLPLLARGKVRDIYSIGDEHLLIVTTDRLSAFDVVLPDPIPGKGAVLTAVSNFWFSRTAGLVPNHVVDMPLEDAVPDADERAEIEGRAIVVRKLRALPVEAIVRGYLIGSGWKDYQASGAVCGIALPGGLQLADRLPEPIFTPSTKAEVGGHDMNIDFDRTRELLGDRLAEEVRDVSLKIYTSCAAYALERGIIIADTKFEFGLDENDRLVLIDEVLTPDSSRFWPADSYRPGQSPASFDKQYVRDYLETLDWDKTPPGPVLPAEVIANTAARYREAQERLTR